MSSALDDRLVGVLLAGGSGTRMRPLTDHTNKHLIPVYMRPMIEYPLATLLGMGLRNILVVTGRRHMGQVVDVLGSGSKYGRGVELTYKVQDEARGIAHALGLAERFAAGRRVVVMLADNFIDDDRVIDAAHAFADAEVPYALNFLSEVDDPRPYGVATVDGNRIVRIVEKPAVPESNLAVTGVYLYPPDVFERVQVLRPSGRGELEITDVNNAYLAEGRLRSLRIDRWFDCGEPEPWMRTQDYVATHPERFGDDRFQLKARA